MGVGCVIQGFGLLLPVAGFLVMGPLGLLLGGAACVILLLLGSSKSIRFVCGHCANPVYGQNVKVCPACGGALHKKGVNWLFVAIVVGVCLTGIALWVDGIRMERVQSLARSTAKWSAESRETLKSPLPDLKGKTYASVVSEYGEPTRKDATTGWAYWPEFQAQFVGGIVSDVSK
jgi:hypothetical protein